MTAEQALAGANGSAMLSPRQVERLLEDLDFHRLAAEQPLQLAHLLLETACSCP
jgi:hypothetical protein